MTEPLLIVSVISEPAAVVIQAGGEIDLLSASAVPEAAREVAGAGADTPVLLDLSEVAFMDSSGLRGLLEARRTIADAGRPFGLLRPSPAVRRVLELVDLTEHLPVVASTAPEELRRLG